MTYSFFKNNKKSPGERNSKRLFVNVECVMCNVRCNFTSHISHYSSY